MPMVVIGWKTTRGGDTPNRLQLGSTHLFTSERCGRAEATEPKMSASVCAGESSISMCDVDDGSPLIYDTKKNPILVGIEIQSRRSNCNPSGLSDFVFVADYIDWIQETICSP